MFEKFSNIFYRKLKQYKKLIVNVHDNTVTQQTKELTFRIHSILEMVGKDTILLRYFDEIKYKNFLNFDKFKEELQDLDLQVWFTVPGHLYWGEEKARLSDDEISYICNIFLMEFPYLVDNIEFRIIGRHMIGVRLW